ncbi:uncharacterized protein LOC123532295 isoform X2 [Mercenaria mercenaria]|uniref:uncharacterized protein LOC123532295 isoform X2 n=1 Tax=Mercenaria mercenaria TaxID=6596 RepID=UPI00234FAF33|nr:uncharacterized protein LOC123532295 isoform X2 [Mercenaria mercenaria]
MYIIHVFVAVFFVCTVDAGTLKCRQCNKATTLSDCNRMVTCDDTLEDCFLDELITEQLTVVYEGGCRPKDVCSKAGRKKRDLVACSRCCANGDDCNSRLCAIPNHNISATQCYFCDHRSPSQSSISRPDQCVTLTTCQADEVCFTQARAMGSFYLGCQKKALCTILMQKVFQEMDLCNNQPETCGGIKRSINVCDSCCAMGGCNVGYCNRQNERLYRLWKQGLFDVHTLKTLNGSDQTSG